MNKSVDIPIIIFENHLQYVDLKFKNMFGKSHGTRVRLARLLNFQTSYLSKVFSGKAQLSVEDGYKIARFLNLDGLETKYFLFLILKARTLDPQLKLYFDDQLNELKIHLKDLYLSKNIDFQTLNLEKL